MAVVEGTRTFAAPPERVFAKLTDPDVIAPALPGVRGHAVSDPEHFQAKVKPPVPLAPSLTIRFEVLDKRPPDHAELHAHGGGADIRSTFDLEPRDGGTFMHWHTEYHLSGLLDRLAGSGLHSIAEHQAIRMLDAVDHALL